LKIYVGNLSFKSDEESLKKLFSQHGNVASVDIVKDRGTGRSRGFAFIEMPDQKEADAAIANLNGQDVDGWKIKVNKAETKESKGGPKPPTA